MSPPTLTPTTSGVRAPWPRLRSLPCLTRLGIACLLCVLVGGMVVSGRVLYNFYEPRDERPGLTVRDIEGGYHGTITPSPLLDALERGHPKELGDAPRAKLVAWLKGAKVAESYENIDLGEDAPSEIMAASCVKCHSRKAPESVPQAARAVPLDYWTDVKPLAFSKEILPTDVKLMATSSHAHTLALSTLCLVLACMLGMTRWPRGMNGVLALAMGLGLLVDMGSWWITREHGQFAYAIVIGGFVFAAGVVLSSLAILFEIMLPERAGE